MYYINYYIKKMYRFSVVLYFNMPLTKIIICAFLLIYEIYIYMNIKRFTFLLALPDKSIFVDAHENTAKARDFVPFSHFSK